MTVVNTSPVTSSSAVFMAWRQDWEYASYGKSLGSAGFSLHMSEAELNQHKTEHWASMPVDIPKIYERPAGQARQVRVDRATYLNLVGQGKSGLRRLRVQPPSA